MLKLTITTKNDLQEAAKIEKRRREEEERKLRIFNPVQRLIGIDVSALEQVAEKKKQGFKDAEEERKYNEEIKRRTMIICRKERELKEHRARLNHEINEYRSRYQRPEDRREYDIEYYHKIAKPARSLDFDPNLGLSSCQVFEGEDIMNKERQKLQKEQQKAWLEQQIRERQRAEEDRKKVDNMLQGVGEKLAMEFDAFEQNKRKQMLLEVANYNKNLAVEQEERRRRAKQEEEEDNLAEIYNNLTSDMLTENKEVAQSALGQNKKLSYAYRGMSESELEKFRRDQEACLEEQKQRKLQQNQDEKLWHQMSMSQMRNLMLKQIEIERRRRNQILELSDENNKLAEEQKSRLKAWEHHLSTNSPSQEFFDQFNRSTR